ncbi:MAG: gephyrin-like molybdotransferase Glp [Myxococcota bacterium]
MPEFLKLLSCDEARRILAGFAPVGGEDVPTARGLGRVLAEDFRAPHDLPREPRSTVDGYAVRAKDTFGASDGVPCYLKLIGAVPMGGVFAGAIGAGEAVAISTGGVVPEGADGVVMIEYVDAARDGEIEIHRGVSPLENVIRRGDDLTSGDVVVARGRRLRPADIGALAGFGQTRVRVFRAPRVAVLSTGNEVVAPDIEPAPGQVRDVNQYALAAQGERAGAEATLAGIVRDDAPALRARVAELLEVHDVVMLSGGSSVGARDVAAEVVGSLGPRGVLLHGINIRPGRPTLVADIGGKPVLGMPGFPVSAMVIFDVFVRPLLRRIGGEAGREEWPARRRARFARRYASAVGREDWVRVRLAGEWASPILGGSAAISTVLRADGYVRVEAGVEGIDEGAEVDVLLMTE